MRDEEHQSSRVTARILCIERDPETAASIADALPERGLAVRVVKNGLDAVAEILRDAPNLVLFDARSVRDSSVDLLERLIKVAPRFASIPFVFLTTPLDRIDAFLGRQVGVDRCVVTPIDFDVLETVIKANIRPARAANRIRRKPMTLKHRQIETLTWVARGKTSVQIAQILGLTKRTVDFHIDNARKMLGVATRTEAAIKASQDRLIKP
jgi:DNA-binding NarL/FixJ family response regulator